MNHNRALHWGWCLCVSLLLIGCKANQDSLSDYVKQVERIIRVPIKLENVPKEDMFKSMMSAHHPHWFAAAAARYQAFLHTLLVGLGPQDGLTHLLVDRTEPYSVVDTITSLQNGLLEKVEMERRRLAKEAKEAKKKANKI